jgi:hypothetical protein
MISKKMYCGELRTLKIRTSLEKLKASYVSDLRSIDRLQNASDAEIGKLTEHELLRIFKSYSHNFNTLEDFYNFE